MVNKGSITHEGFFSGGYMGATTPFLKIQPLKNPAIVESIEGKKLSVQEYSHFTPLALRLASCQDGLLARTDDLVTVPSTAPSYVGSHAFLELEGGTALGEWHIFQGLSLPKRFALKGIYIAALHPLERDMLQLQNRHGSIDGIVAAKEVIPLGVLQSFKAKHRGEKYQKLVDGLPLWKSQVEKTLSKTITAEPNTLVHASDYLDERFSSMYVIVGTYNFSYSRQYVFK